MNAQRVSLACLGLFVLTASVGSAFYFKNINGLAAPIMTAFWFIPSSWASGLTVVVTVPAVLLAVGVLAWIRCRPLLTYPFIAAVVLFVIASEWVAWLVAHGE